MNLDHSFELMEIYLNECSLCTWSISEGIRLYLVLSEVRFIGICTCDGIVGIDFVDCGVVGMDVVDCWVVGIDVVDCGVVGIDDVDCCMFVGFRPFELDLNCIGAGKYETFVVGSYEILMLYLG